MTAARRLALSLGLPSYSACLASALGLGLGLGVVACEKKPDPVPAPVPSASAPTTTSGGALGDAMAADGSAAPRAAGIKLDKLPRSDFNRLAAELALPLFWSEDKNKDGVLDTDELAVYWGLVPGASLVEYVGKDGFTSKAQDAVESIAKRAKDAAPPAGLDPKESARREAVNKEIAQGRVALVATDLSKASPEEKRFVGFITHAAELVEKLYGKQLGTFDVRSKLAEGDTASKFVFFRNQSPRCEAPKTQNDPACSAIPDLPKTKLSGMYPASLLEKAKFCDDIARKETIKSDKEDPDKNKRLMAPFTVVVEDEKNGLKAVPYHEAFKPEVEAISGQLKAAAEALGEKEPALKAYVLAAAQAFLDDKWWPADEAWARMDAKNSKFFLRVGPDETYREPCSTKALFHVSFAMINPGSLEWQNKLDPLKAEMEKALADLAGAPYKAREVNFKLPDFIDVALNAGDSRPPFGASVGQSLPNFGPVAKSGGRTMVMTNLYGDPDSIEALKGTTESLLCKDAMAKYTTDPGPQRMSVVLHEAAHNLGPAHEYKAGGKSDREAFGGPLASTLEELKAQTAALYFTDWLVAKKTITTEDAEKAHVRDIVWSFGHISRGMYDDEKHEHPKNYSHLAAIQLGWLMQNGAVTWKAEETAANGKDKGCFSLALEKFPANVKTLMTEVAQIKGKGDKARAEKLVKEHVDVTGEKKKIHEVITERVLRAPKPSFVYAIKVD